MSEHNFTTDIARLSDDIRAEAEKYDLCCTIVAIGGESVQRIDFGGADADDVYALDCAGGFMLGLSILLLEQDGLLDTFAPLSNYIPASELPKAAEKEYTAHLLFHNVQLPDPLHGVLLPRLHRSAEFAALNGEETVMREQEELLAHRSLAAQTALLQEGEELPATGLAHSSLDEAIYAELVKRVSGQSLAEFQRGRILQPLGIDDVPASAGKEPPENALLLTVEGLTALMRGIADGRVLEEIGMDIASVLARSGRHTLPFGHRGDILCAHSRAGSCTIEMLINRRDGAGVLIASRRPLPEIRRGDGFARLDVDIARLMNPQDIYPSETVLARVSRRLLADVLAIEPDCGQEDFIATPAVAVAEAYSGKGEAFAIREGSNTVGLLTFIPAQIPDTVLLDTLLIDRRYQRRGFGRIAVRWAISYQRKRGCTRLMVCVERRNTAARALYDSFGFEVIEVHDRAFVLALKLN